MIADVEPVGRRSDGELGNSTVLVTLPPAALRYWSVECLGGNVPIDPKRLSAFRTLEAANALWDEGLASIEVPPDERTSGTCDPRLLYQRR